ncbi:MAG: pilus assembly protein PilP [Myxococcota bacterium]
METEEEYRYDPAGKPDPFRSFVSVALANEAAAAASSPLERFDLSQLSVTGIIWGAEHPHALVVDPAGKGYVIAVGTSIGKNKGKVIRIEDNRVLVRETYVDLRDRATTGEVELRLYESQGG